MVHNVKFNIPERELGKKDVEFKVSRGGTKIGTLKVSKGSVVWVPRDRSIGHKMSWQAFGGLMGEHGKRGIII